MKVDALDHLVINVADVERSARWYGRALGMERLDFEQAGQIRTAMLFGSMKINLRPIGTSKQDWFTADHEGAGAEDLCFLTQASPEAMVAHLRACEVAIITGPELRNGVRGKIMSVYCRDPDGSLIEISSYPDR